jgi:hypothetical protein
VRRADVQRRMLRVAPPMSNAERQRLFRERNPDYYRLRRARQRAETKTFLEQQAAVRVAAVHREPLMLPAPVEVMEIPGVNAIPAAGETVARKPVPIAIPSAFASFFEA